MTFLHFVYKAKYNFTSYFDIGLDIKDYGFSYVFCFHFVVIFKLINHFINLIVTTAYVHIIVIVHTAITILTAPRVGISDISQ